MTQWGILRELREARSYRRYEGNVIVTSDLARMRPNLLPRCVCVHSLTPCVYPYYMPLGRLVKDDLRETSYGNLRFSQPLGTPGVTAALYGEVWLSGATTILRQPKVWCAASPDLPGQPLYCVTRRYDCTKHRSVGQATLLPRTPSGKEQKKEQKMCALDRIYISQFLRRCPPSGVPCELLPRLLGWLKLRSTPHSARTTLSMAFRSAWFLHSRASTQASPPLPLSPCYQLTHYPHYIHGLRQGQSRLC